MKTFVEIEKRVLRYVCTDCHKVNPCPICSTVDMVSYCEIKKPIESDFEVWFGCIKCELWFKTLSETEIQTVVDKWNKLGKKEI